MAAKAGGEHRALPAELGTPAAIEQDVNRLHAILDDAQQTSTLPDRPAAEPALHDFLIRQRLG
jgi:hypothetical protein